MGESTDVDGVGRRNRQRSVDVSVAVVAAVLPFVVAAISLTRERWYPVLDMAMTELRVRDVGGADTPLIGLPGRIGDFPDQGSHPGPISFWLLAPFHWITGGRAYGMQLGSLVVNATLAAGIVETARGVGRRRGSATAGAFAALAVVGVATRGYGFDLLGHPWNPYFPLLWWMAILVATWRVVDGDRWPIVAVTVGGTVVAQTHVPYLPLAVSMVAVCAVALVVRARADGWRELRRPVLVAVGVASVLWIPPVVDQMANEPGNVSMLVDHFAADPPGPSLGVVDGAELALRHLDLPAAVWNLVTGSEAFVELSSRPGGSVVGGVLTVIVWLGLAVGARRRRLTSLVRLHAVLAVAVVVGWLAMSRIFGAVWYYLTLWAWGTTTLVGAAMVWTAIELVVSRRVGSSRDSEAATDTTSDDPGGRQHQPAGVLVRGAVVAGSIAALGATLTAFGQRPPDAELSQGLGLVVPDTIRALESGAGPAPGPDATYVVFWQDATFIGAQGYGLVDELERAGFDVGVHPTWRVPVTPHRVLALDDIDAEVHLVTGPYIDRWRADDTFVEVAHADPATDDERAEFDRLRERAIGALADEGCPACVDDLDLNLFGVVVTARERRFDSGLIADLERMLEIGRPVSVFLTPPGNSF